MMKAPSEAFLESNLQRWASAHPREAVLLQFLSCEDWRFAKTKQEEWNLMKGDTPLHDPEGALREAEEWFSSLDLEGIDVLYVYGAGLGYGYRAAEKWLRGSKERGIVFLEDELEVVRRLLETENAAAMLTDQQAALRYLPDFESARQMLLEIYWHFPMKNIRVSALPYYLKEKYEKFEEIGHAIAYDTALKNLNLEEYLIGGAPFFRNYYENLPLLEGAFLGDALFGKFRGVPAVICGAGPSLEKNIEYLKKVRGSALIFGGSSALNALEAHGVAPHFAAGIDPNPAQLERISALPALKAPFLYRNRFYPPALKRVQGPRVFITGSGGYDIHKWFEEKLGIQGKEIEEGYNVVNFCLEVAYAFGCDPIIFAGMDLAYSGNRLYASGIEEDSTIDEKELMAVEDIEKRPLKREDIHGNEVLTLWKWVSEAKWIGDFALEHPEVRIVNATEGGLGFPGVPNIPLNEMLKEEKERALEKKVEELLQEAKLTHVTGEKIAAAKRELGESLQRCCEHLKILDEENRKVMEKVEAEQKVDLLQTGLGALAETDLAEEPAFTYVLEIFNGMYNRFLTRKIEKAAGKKDPVEKALAELEINGEKFRYLLKVAEINSALLNLPRAPL